VICPIGKKGSDVRKHSDQLLKHVLTPVMKRKLHYEIIRGDDIKEPGIINNQVFRNLIESDIVIADLTYKNGNVFYELAVRHIIGKPFIHLIDVDEKEKPFDLSGTRMIQFKLDLDEVNKAKAELLEYVKSTEADDFDLITENPLSPLIQKIGSTISTKKFSEEIVQLDPNLKRQFDENTTNMMNQISIQLDEIRKQIGITKRVTGLVNTKKVKIQKETKDNIDALNRLEDNLKSIKNIVSTEPPKIDVANCLLTANVHYYEGRYREALNAYEEILEYDPKNLDALINKGWSLTMLGNEGEAVRIADQITEIDPQNLVALDIKATTLLNSGYDLESLAITEKILKRDPNNKSAIQSKGILLANLTKFEESIPFLEKANKESPNTMFILERLGASYKMTGRKKEATRIFKQIQSIKPRDQIDWNSKGNALSIMKRFKESIRAYDKALEIDPNYIQAIVNKGNSLALMNRLEEAIEEYDKALEADPISPTTLKFKGIVFTLMQKYEKALEAFSQALEISPKDAVLWNRKGEVLEKLQRYKDAKNAYEKALKIDPVNEEAKANKQNVIKKI
jgi:tetratricopeptide (TPR) repeat protein